MAGLTGFANAARLSAAFARELGLSAQACREAGLAGLLHDVGKALMPLDLLNKPGKLTAAEYTLMKQPPQRGHELPLVLGLDAREDGVVERALAQR